jgi:uncharacterized membrane protein
MAFCPNCGAQVTGTFCPNCGTNVSAASASGAAGTSGIGAGTAGAGYVPPGSPQPIATAPGMTENVAGALCYLAGFITGIIFLVIAPYNQNRFVRFHAFQAIIGHVALIVLWIVFIFITHGFGFILYPLFGLGVFVLWLYMMYSAYNNKKVKLPVIGDIAEKQA